MARILEVFPRPDDAGHLQGEQTRRSATPENEFRRVSSIILLGPRRERRSRRPVRCPPSSVMAAPDR